MEPSKKSFTGRKGTAEACSCNFEDMIERACARMNFLKKHGEDLPESAITKAVEEEVAENWIEYCDCQNRKDIVAAVHYENNDWYLCTMKNLAVKPETRGYGIGTDVVAEAVEKASQDPNCMVLAADITYDNKDCIRVFEKAGFETVGEFCWGKGQKPADILHFIRFKPTQDKNCLAPVLPKAKPAPAAAKTIQEEPFTFRGLRFKGISGGIGLRVWDTKTKKWVDTAILNRRVLERDYFEVPDLAMWQERVPIGTIRFPESAKPAPAAPEVNKQPTEP